MPRYSIFADFESFFADFKTLLGTKEHKRARSRCALDYFSVTKQATRP